MGHDEQPIGLAGIEREACRRSLEREPGPPEHQQVEVELARTPALALLAPERPLELLEGDEQRGGTRRRIRTGRDVERNDGIPERRLVDDADGLGGVQPRHGPEARAGQGCERPDAALQRRRRIAEVGPQPDVRPDAPQVEPPSFSTLGRMTAVAVLILHPAPARDAGEIETWVGAARAAMAERHRAGFVWAGADSVTVTGGPPDGQAFGTRLATFLEHQRPGGVVVLGSGAVPLATMADRRAFVEAARASGQRALANNRYSADIVAIATAGRLVAAERELRELASDNALPRWLGDVAGYEVADRRSRWRLGFDIDGPLDLALLGPGAWAAAAPPDGVLDRVVDRLGAIRAVAHGPAAELVVAGRAGTGALAWLEGATASRTRALVEERGLRTRVPGQRPARSTLGLLLDRDGPGSLGAILGELGAGALVDTRVLLAHHFGADERGWPRAEDRFASDLLAADRIHDPWLRALTTAADEAPIPIVLGGHSLVGPGLRLALGRRRRWI